MPRMYSLAPLSAARPSNERREMFQVPHTLDLTAYTVDLYAADEFPSSADDATADFELASGKLLRMPTDLTREAGYHFPVLVSLDAHTDAVLWERTPIRESLGNYDQNIRAGDVLWMAKRAVTAAIGMPGQSFSFEMKRIRNFELDGSLSRRLQYDLVTLKVVAGQSHVSGCVCVVIALPNEEGFFRHDRH